MECIGIVRRVAPAQVVHRHGDCLLILATALLHAVVFVRVFLEISAQEARIVACHLGSQTIVFNDARFRALEVVKRLRERVSNRLCPRRRLAQRRRPRRSNRRSLARNSRVVVVPTDSRVHRTVPHCRRRRASHRHRTHAQDQRERQSSAQQFRQPRRRRFSSRGAGFQKTLTDAAVFLRHRRRAVRRHSVRHHRHRRRRRRRRPRVRASVRPRVRPRMPGVTHERPRVRVASGGTKCWGLHALHYIKQIRI